MASTTSVPSHFNNSLFLKKANYQMNSPSKGPRTPSFIRNIYDPRLGEVKLLKDPSSDSYIMQKMASLSDDSQIVPFLKTLEKRKSSPCVYYVPLLSYMHRKESNYCANSHKVHTFTPYPEEDLTKDIAERVASNQVYSNREVTSLLYDLVGAGLHLQKMGFVHTSISPDWVALTTTGYALIEDPLQNKNRVLKIDHLENVYLSPEAYRAAKQARVHGSNFCKVKSDVFSVGLVLLHAGLLRPSPDIYRGKRGETVDVAALENNLKEFESRYCNNNLVKTTVRRMLSVDPQHRPDFKELKARLPDYKVVKTFFEKNHDSVPQV